MRRAIHVHVYDNEFKESQHPRDPDGKFGSGGSSKTDGEKDLTHLNALEHRLSNERGYLTKAKTDKERELRKVWIAQIEKEIAREKKFLGLPDKEDDLSDLSDEELLAELNK